ncbi:MAG TPA: peptidase S58, partial [Achromobacter sp.]|nr:peptidase S58 [Achromobacter sp.]
MAAAAGAAAFAGGVGAQGAKASARMPGSGSITDVAGLRVCHYTDT